jgi:hypothetical protein
VSVFAVTFIALYVGHHVGDYWVQTDAQAAHKGDAGPRGRGACISHVSTYVFTQAVVLGLACMALGTMVQLVAFWVALLVSGLTHYAADRREHGLMFKLARRIPGKAKFLELGKDSGSLGTGAWALDQSWHLFFGVFVPALILGAWR